MKYCPVCGEGFESRDECPLDGAVLVLDDAEADPLIGEVLKGEYKIEELIGRADVLVQNFRPGVVDRMGIGESDIRAVAPDIVYVSIRRG